jgi:spartin
MSPTSDAYVLVTIPSATLTSSSTGTLTGQLVLEYVTYDIPRTAQVTQDVLLVLVLRSGNNNNTMLFEAPLDPARALSVSSVPPPSSYGVARRRYVLHATRDDTELTVELPENDNNSVDDIELFHSVLVGYVTDVRVNGEQLQQQSSAPPLPARVAEAAAPVAGAGVADEDLRGRFVLMNEDDGEIVGTLDRSVKVIEDPSIGVRGHEKDTLVVEVPEGADTQDGLLEEEVLVSTIPPEERDWMVKTAVFVSHAISGTTTLLTSAMAGASNLYIAHSTPSTSAPGSTTASRPTTPSSSPRASQKSQGQGQSYADPSARSPPAPPSRTLLLLQSPTTRKNLTQIHAVSGSAAKLSSKAADTVESLIQRAIGSGSSSPIPSSISSPSSSPNKGKGRASASADRVKSPTPRPQPQPQQQQQAPTAAAPLRTRTSVALSAALILASIEASAVRLVEAGGAAVSAAVTHKYGTEAGENAALAGRTARNIVLVYVDVRGLGRRVIVKRMAKTWVKGRIASARQEQAAAQKKR